MFVPQISAVFLHIPKTGGESVAETLSRAFGPPDSKVLDTNPSSLKHAKAVYWVKAKEIEKKPVRFFITVYRPPHERVLSMLLWRMQNSSKWHNRKKKITLRVLWQSIESTETITDFIRVPPGQSAPLAILPFSQLNKNLAVFLAVTGAVLPEGESHVHINKNPLKQRFSSSLPFWTLVARIMVLFTRHRGDYKYDPRGNVKFTFLPCFQQ